MERVSREDLARNLAALYAQNRNGDDGPTSTPRRLVRGVPPLYHDAAVADFPGLSVPPTPRDLLILGFPGRGKSHLAAALLHYWSEGTWLSASHWLLRLRSTRTEDQAFEDASDPRVLVLDDLGALQQSDYSRSRVLALLDHRMTHRRPTIITTAQSSQELSEWCSALYSRLAASLKIVLEGPCRREPQGQTVRYAPRDGGAR